MNAKSRQPQRGRSEEPMTNGNQAATSLRALIQRGRIVAAPGAYDALSALIIEQAGFEAIYLTGNGQTASMLGLPDVGLITLTEMADRVRCMRAVTTVPLIADADVGYGSMINVRRAMRDFEAAGASAVQFEDQVSPKKCGHELGREIVTTDEMMFRLQAAVDGRQNPETMIIARTDARTTHGLGEAIERGRAYVKAGADIIFVESPESEAELKEVAASVPAPTLANMVETGRTPYLSAPRLGELGFAVAIYPATAFLAATHAVSKAMEQLRSHGRLEDMSRIVTLEEYHKVLSFSTYSALEGRLRTEVGAQAAGGWTGPGASSATGGLKRR
jgi:2-methylisocitrate lyase-like PEP mutase family enzyme